MSRAGAGEEQGGSTADGTGGSGPTSGGAQPRTADFFLTAPHQPGCLSMPVHTIHAIRSKRMLAFVVRKGRRGERGPTAPKHKSPSPAAGGGLRLTHTRRRLHTRASSVGAPRAMMPHPPVCRAPAWTNGPSPFPDGEAAVVTSRTDSPSIAPPSFQSRHAANQCERKPVSVSLSAFAFMARPAITQRCAALRWAQGSRPATVPHLGHCSPL